MGRTLSGKAEKEVRQVVRSFKALTKGGPLPEGITFFGGGGPGVKRGSPVSTHAGDGSAQVDYTLDDGGTQTGVYNRTGVEALTTNKYWLFFQNNEWQSFPAQLDLCNPTNPIQ